MAILQHSNDQVWQVSWHSSDDPPTGDPHGSVGICVTPAMEIVLVSSDGLHWDFPAGRPEGAETWEQTLRREIAEEACAHVESALLLGFSRGECVRGRQRGLVLVRAFWRAEVTPDAWEPKFEIEHRRLVSVDNLLPELRREGDRVPILVYEQALLEAGLSSKRAPRW